MSTHRYKPRGDRYGSPPLERSKAPVGCDFCPGINPSYAQQQEDGRWWCMSCDRTLRAEDIKGLCPLCEDKGDVLVSDGRLVRCGTCGTEAPHKVWEALPRRCLVCAAEMVATHIAEACGVTKAGLRALLKKLAAEGGT